MANADEKPTLPPTPIFIKELIHTLTAAQCDEMRIWCETKGAWERLCALLDYQADKHDGCDMSEIGPEPE